MVAVILAEIEPATTLPAMLTARVRSGIATSDCPFKGTCNIFDYLTVWHHHRFVIAQLYFEQYLGFYIS